jgi:hypothetical protein
MSDDLVLRNAEHASRHARLPVEDVIDVPPYAVLTGLDREPGTGVTPMIARQRANRERTLRFVYSGEEYLMALSIIDTLSARWGIDAPAAVVLEALQRAADTDET